MHPSTHPDHDELTAVILQWSHQPYSGMGYRAEKRHWGTYWSHGHVHTLGLPPGEALEFVRDVQECYPERPVYINVHGRSVDRQLGIALTEAGCAQGKSDVFLAHVGAVPQIPAVEGLSVENVDESNLILFAHTRLRAFAKGDDQPTEEKVQAEAAVRRLELTGSGRGMLARAGGEAAAVIWWYDDPRDVWITLLGTGTPFRCRGIASWLLCNRLARSYARGCRSVVLHVETGNHRARRLYHRLGFQDEVHWRHRYVVRN
jgi:ribosomal protein S18 acetylase RimI-like enzyme